MKDDVWGTLSDESQNWNNEVIKADDFHVAIDEAMKKNKLSRPEAIELVRAKAEDPELFAHFTGDDSDFLALPGIPELGEELEPDDEGEESPPDDDEEEEEEERDEKTKPRKSARAAAKTTKPQTAKAAKAPAVRAKRGNGIDDTSVAVKKKIAKAKPPIKKKAEKKTETVTTSTRLGKRAQIEADARAGKLPPVPDFAADTHKYWRPKLEEVVKLVKARDVKGLKQYAIKTYSTSPRAIDRYRQLAILALEAQKSGRVSK